MTGIVLLVILSILPGDMQVRSAAPKELEHFAAYLLTAGALTLGFWSRRHALLIVLSLGLLSGFAEWAQAGIPGRTTHVADAVASIFGAVAGAALALCVRSL